MFALAETYVVGNTWVLVKLLGSEAKKKINVMREYIVACLCGKKKFGRFYNCRKFCAFFLYVCMLK